MDNEAFIINMLRQLPKLSSVDSKIVLRDMYETHYGICNHLDRNNTRPLASVALHPAEDINTGSFLEESIRLYISRGIKDLYQLSLVQFLDLPRDIVRMLCDIAGEENSRKSTMMSQIEDQFKRTGN